jgi:2,3-bisphosphoglycerate-independent phosphoglycerate mutase
MSVIKVAVLVPDGAADVAIAALGGKTPLEAARKPNMDRVAREGATGTAATVPAGIPPGSDVANLALMGYNPVTHYGGRAPIEAANLGIEIPDGWTAFRCNLIKTDTKHMLDYSGGHIGQAASERSVEALEAELGDDETHFYPGKSYRNVLLIKGDYKDVRCTPPHDITYEAMMPYLPRGKGAERINHLMERSLKVLARVDTPADMIWLWGQGPRMSLEPFVDLYGLTGFVISAVDLVCGIGRLAGLVPLDVPGATGYLDTDYAAKGRAALEALQRDDFVFVHVEAPDEASHMGDLGEKVKAIEKFDELVVGPVLEGLAARGDPFRVLVAPDHPTLISTRTHDGSPVPYAVTGEGVPASGATIFSESEAARHGPLFREGYRLMGHLTGAEWETGV